MAKEKNNEARQNIIRNAFYMFQDEAYDKVLMRDLAARCGIGQPLLQYYFNRKEDLLVQIFYDLHIKVSNYIHDHLTDDIRNSGCNAQKLHIGVTYMLFFKTLSCDNERLLDLFSQLLNNTQLLKRTTDLIFAKCPWNKNSLLDLDNTICAYVLNGCLQQFTLLYKDGSPMLNTLEKTVDLALDCYYGYSGLSINERQQLISAVHAIVTEDVVQEFYAQYIGGINDGFV
ncbi:MAG: TetR/AcrR family transcriptional regulator, partial [Oscillospiraceae bacterium]|nr:TetR/AcrR family transcriptional regulator [Oscillospiraceae bacterium]